MEEKKKYRRKKKPKVITPIKESPKSGVCMCPDGSYAECCCNGDLHAQGIGKLESDTKVEITNNNGLRTIKRTAK